MGKPASTAVRRERQPRSKRPKNGEVLPPPTNSFTSAGGRVFQIGFGMHEERSKTDLFWTDSWPILFEGRPAGKLFRDLMYGRDVPRWHASTRDLYWSKAADAPTGIGFDVGVHDALEDAIADWGRRADEILDWAEGKPVYSIYSKIGFFRKAWPKEETEAFAKKKAKFEDLHPFVQAQVIYTNAGKHAGVISRRSSRSDEILHRVSCGVRDDEKHGLLPELAGDPRGDLLGSSEERSTRALDGRGKDFDHETLLPFSLPHTATLEKGRPVELVSDEPLDVRTEDPRIERGRKRAVLSTLARDARSDVEPDRARGRKIPRRATASKKRATGHDASVARRALRDLEDSVPRRKRSFYFFMSDGGEGELVLETSWLPLSVAEETLAPLGFKRKKSGAWRLVLSKEERQDELRVARAVHKATRAMMEAMR